MSKEQDQLFFRNFSLAMGCVAAMMVVFYVVAHFAGSNDEALAKMRAAQVAKITAPVGKVTAEGEKIEEITEETTEKVAATDAANTTASGDVGESVFNGVCVNCHGMAALSAMIPQAGDAAAWGPRIKKGIDTLHDHAINGFTGELGMMPAKGGNPSLSDEEVKAAVDYIVKLVQ